LYQSLKSKNKDTEASTLLHNIRSNHLFPILFLCPLFTPLISQNQLSDSNTKPFLRSWCSRQELFFIISLNDGDYSIVSISLLSQRQLSVMVISLRRQMLGRYLLFFMFLFLSVLSLVSSKNSLEKVRKEQKA
jgi:hypothetical protein